MGRSGRARRILRMLKIESRFVSDGSEVIGAGTWQSYTIGCIGYFRNRVLFVLCSA